jgi:uncharacterized protein YggU (UPF0235/DUF167 family)
MRFSLFILIAGCIWYNSIKPYWHKVKRISVKVTPKASRARVEPDLLPDEHGNQHFKVYVTVVPEAGKANEAVIELLSDFLDIPKSKFNIIKGETNRNKVLEINA